MFYQADVCDLHIADIYALQSIVYGDRPHLIEDKSCISSIVACGLSYIMYNNDVAIGYALIHTISIENLDQLPVLNNSINVTNTTNATLTAGTSTSDHQALFIHDLCVHPSFRKSGYATQLVKHIIETNTSNLPIYLVSLQESISFWKRLGAVITTLDKNESIPECYGDGAKLMSISLPSDTMV